MSKEEKQKNKKMQETQIRGMFQEELQQQPEQIIEKMKKILERLKI